MLRGPPAVMICTISKFAKVTIREDDGAEPALADRLHLSEGDWLGLVLFVDRARRLLPLHRCLEAVHHDEGRGRHRWKRVGSADIGAGPSQRGTAASSA